LGVHRTIVDLFWRKAEVDSFAIVIGQRHTAIAVGGSIPKERVFVENA
jgi:hypothetical protein